MWSLVRQRGLDPDLTSFSLSLLLGIPSTRMRLHRIMPRTYASSVCPLCGPVQAPETIEHALGTCEANQGLSSRMLDVLRIYQPGAELPQMLTLDLGLESSLELPLTWTICSLLFSIWRQRTEGQVIIAKSRAELEPKCKLLRDGKVRSLTNAYILTNNIINVLFRGL